MFRRAMFIILCCVFFGVSSTAGATIVKQFTLRGLTVEAHEIVRGEVVDEEVVYDSWWGRVYTHTTVRVDEVLGGEAHVGDLIVIRQLGGALDGLETVLVGTAEFTLGDEVMLFTRTDGALHYLIGMAQGSYFVHRDNAGKAIVTRALGQLGFAPTPMITGHRAPNRTTLDQLRGFVAAFRHAGGTP